MTAREALPEWLDYARRLAGLAQTGLHFATDSATIARYTELRQIAAEIIAAHSTLELETARALLSQDHGYATPRTAVGAVIFHENRLLLVRQGDDGGWSLPIGWAELDESPALTAVREIREESGLEARVVRLLGVFEQDRQASHPLLVHRYLFLYRCELLDTAQLPQVDGEEITAVAFFSQEEIAALQLSPTRVTHNLLRRCFDFLADPDAPAAFD